MVKVGLLPKNNYYFLILLKFRNNYLHTDIPTYLNKYNFGHTS